MKSERDSIPIVILRIAGCYDDECHSIPISNQIQRIYENQFASHVLPGDISHGTSFLHLDDLAEAIWCSVQKREILPADTVLLVGEEERLSYDQIQNQVSHLVRGKDLHTYRIPKFIAKIGAWLQDKLPFMPKSFIKPWMIDYADDNYDLDMNHTNETLNWKPSRKLQEVLPVMVAELKKDPLKWYQVNGLEAPKWLQKRESNKHA